MGKIQGVGGFRGGLATAIACAEPGRLAIPKSRRKVVGIGLATWHWTAFTWLPFRDGEKVVPFQIPNTMSPFGVFAVFRFKLTTPAAGSL
jgi:hypothetical protein